MQFWSLLFVLFVAFACVVSVRAEDSDVDESDVVVLTSDNFDSTLADNEFVLVEFYAPWCGHCKRLIPEYASAATTLKDKDIVLAKVDATVESDLAGKFDVKGYPTLKFFRSGEAGDYSGGRTASEIVAWLNKKTGPPSTELEKDGVADFVSGKLAVVGEFASRTSDEYKKFLAAAKSASLDDFAFADYTGDANTVTLHAAHLDEPLVFDGEGDLADFVLKNGYPLVDELPEAWERYSKKGYPLAILFIDPSEDNTDVLAEVTKAAEATDGFSFSFADGVRFKQQIERMGGRTDNLPSIAAMKLSGKANFPYDGELTADALAAWGKSIVDGSLKPHLKSEAIPEDNNGPVTVVVGKSFKDVVLDAKKDVLLEIYAPWCGHCKSLAPTWEELGEAYADNENVVIAKIDGTANDFDVEYRGFPTIKFFPAGSSSISDMVDFNGGRTLDDLKAFLEDNVKSEGAKDEL